MQGQPLLDKLLLVLLERTAGYEVRKRMSYFDPVKDLSPEQVATIERYYRAAQIGAPAALVQTHYAQTDFVMTEVKYLDLDADRVTLRSGPRFGGPEFFISSGRNCRSPTGRSRLIIPSSEMIAQEVQKRRAQEKRERELAEVWRREEEAASRHMAEAAEERLRRRLPGRWIKARCLKPQCDHQAMVEVASLRFSPDLPADEVISKFYCSKCGSKQIEASWADTP